MEWMTDEWLFYGGLILGGISLLIMIFAFCIFQVKKVRLNVQLDVEYGERKKN